MLDLFREVIRGIAQVSGSRPVARQPLEHRLSPKQHDAGALVAARRCLRFAILEEVRRLVELSEPHRTPRQHVARTVVVLQRETVADLEVDAALEKARGQLPGI